jgi:protein subunit release factor A
MRPWAHLAWGMILVVGCSPSYQTVQKEQISALKELTEILSTVKDQTTMEAARGELARRFDRFEQVAKKAKALPKPSAEVQRQLEEELGPQKERAFDNLLKEVRRITALPGGEEFLKGLGKLR